MSKETDEATRIISTPQSSVQTQENPDTKTLLEEIKILRKELAEQKKSIEQLKQEEAGTR